MRVAASRREAPTQRFVDLNGASPSFPSNYPERRCGTVPADARRMSEPCGCGDERSVLIEEAARRLGVSRRTVYYRIRDGLLQTIRTRGGSQRVLLSSNALLTQSETAPTTALATSESEPLPLEI